MIPRKKCLLLFLGLIFLTFCVSSVASSFTTRRSCDRLFISFTSDQIPLIDVEIQGHHYNLEISLGSKFPLKLNRQLLNQLEKQEAGTITSKDLNGNEKEFQAYLLKQIQIGPHVFNHVLAVENNDDSAQGTIGRPLLANRNLLIDFPNSTMFIDINANELKKIGYHKDHWIKTPLSIGRIGVILEALTDRGMLRLSLGLGTKRSLIKPTFMSQTDLPYFTTSKFILGGTDFGKKNLHEFPITNELDEIDGILGGDFLQQHLIYLDFEHHIAHIEE